MSQVEFVTSGDVLRFLERRPPVNVTPPVRQAGTLVPREGSPVLLVISGGQTGADRAGLDAALAVGLPIEGYIPKGRIAEDGIVPLRYGMTETNSTVYGHRTALNVKHSMATLVLGFKAVGDKDRSGTAKTVKLCQKHNRPCLQVQLHPVFSPSNKKVAEVLAWLRKRQVKVLNVAGPRESREVGIYEASLAFLKRVLGQEAT